MTTIRGYRWVLGGWVALAGLFVGGRVGLGAAESDADRAAIVAVLTAQQSDWNKADLPRFMNGYWNSPGVTFAGSRGFIRGWQPVLERYQQTYADRTSMGRLDFRDLEVRKLGPDAALVLGHWQLERQAGNIGGIFTLVFQKFPEGWKIVHDHTTESPAGSSQAN